MATMNRRRFIRFPVHVWVEQWTDQETYHQQSSNLSVGGVYLDRTVPHPEGTLVNLRFELPGDERPIECQGRIVFPRGAEDDFGMGLEFVGLKPADEKRIALHLRAEFERLPKKARLALEGALVGDEPEAVRGRPGARDTRKEGRTSGAGRSSPSTGASRAGPSTGASGKGARGRTRKGGRKQGEPGTGARGRREAPRGRKPGAG